jgi:NADH dehydrogenase
MMIVVTGASGYLGSHIVKRLVEMEKPTRAMVRSRESAGKEERLKNFSVEWVEADVTRPEMLGPAMDGATAVIHTVAIAIEKGGRSYETINYQGTVNVVEAAKAANVRRFINISQLGAASDLPYRFLASKGKAQEYVAASDLDWTAFRPSVIARSSTPLSAMRRPYFSPCGLKTWRRPLSSLWAIRAQSARNMNSAGPRS